MKFSTFVVAGLSIVPIALGTNFDVIVGASGSLTYTPTEIHPECIDESPGVVSEDDVHYSNYRQYVTIL